MEIRTLNRRDVKQLSLEFFDIEKRQKVDIVENKHVLLLVDNVPIAIKYKGRWIPTLKGIQKPIKKIYVDEGAMKFVLSGAHIMRPGITLIEEGIAQNQTVVIMSHEKKPLAVGIALFSSEEMKKMAKGKAVVNIHQVNDSIWNYTPF